MTDPVQTPPAGTPPAQPPAQGGNNQQQTPAPQQGNPQQPPAQNPAPQTFTQDQVNQIIDQRWGEKLGSLEKELGLESGALKNPGPIKDLIAAQKKPKMPPAGATEPLTGAELRMAKMEALMMAGVPSKKIPGLLSRVQGKTKADIEADIQFMLSEGFIILEQPAPPQQQQAPPAQQQQIAAQGAGNQGVPPGPKTWTRSDLSKLPPEEYEKNRSEILAALRDGRVK